MLIKKMSDAEAKVFLGQIVALLGCGENAANEIVVMTCFENMSRRSDCLGLIENYLTVPVIDDDGEEGEDSLLNWGEDPKQYLATFKNALKYKPMITMAQPIEPLQEWCYALDGENFMSGTFSSKSEAVEQCKKEFLDHCDDSDSSDLLTVAICTKPKNSDLFPDADDIIEHMANQADDIGGEYANDYPDASPENQELLTVMLHTTLNEWCDKCEIIPSFYTVGATEEVEL